MDLIIECIVPGKKLQQTVAPFHIIVHVNIHPPESEEINDGTAAVVRLCVSAIEMRAHENSEHPAPHVLGQGGKHGQNEDERMEYLLTIAAITAS